MSSLPPPQLVRPRQVTVAAVLGVLGSFFLVVSLFDTLGSLATPDTRESVARFLSKPPGDGLNLDVAEVVDLLRGVVYVSAALAAAALVCGIFVFQRHAGARIAFTIVSVCLLPTAPLSGVVPFLLVAATLLMWSPPARDWFAGRAPAPRPDPVPAPQAQPSALGGPVAPPPAQVPYGLAAGPQLWEPAPVAEVGPQRVPTNVVVAVVLSWIGAAGAALLTLFVVVAVAGDPDGFVQEFRDAMASSPIDTGYSFTRGQILAGLWSGAALILLWSLVSAVLAVFVLRRAQWARIALSLSAGAAAATSLLMILSIVSAIPLLLALASLGLLFTRASNDWFARRAPRQPGLPPQGPPTGTPYPQPGPPRNKPW